jgi:hypothetical protein
MQGSADLSEHPIEIPSGGLLGCRDEILPLQPFKSQELLTCVKRASEIKEPNEVRMVRCGEDFELAQEVTRGSRGATAVLPAIRCEYLDSTRKARICFREIKSGMDTAMDC